MNDPKRILVIFLALMLVILGVLGIKGIAEDAGYKTQVRYTTAVRAEDADRFNYAVDSQQGNLLVHGEFSTKKENLVKFEEMKQSFTYVERVKEHYTRHESCSTDSDGNRSCTTYYSWDAVGWDELKASEVTFYGRSYSGSLFNFRHFENREADEHYLSSWDRYVYNTVPQRLTATFIASSLEGGLNPIEEDSITLQNKSIDQAMHDVGMYKVWAFWITLVLIILITIGAIFGAYYWVMEDGEWSLDD